MKEFIYELTLVDIGRMGCDKSSCKVNCGKCVELARIGDVNKLRQAFWGPQHDEAIKTKLLESQKDEKRDKENQETQRLRNLKDELKMTADYELQQVQILQMRDELKEKERRRQQNDDDEHQKQRTSNEVMRKMALVNVGKAEYDLDVQRKNLFDKN